MIGIGASGPTGESAAGGDERPGGRPRPARRLSERQSWAVLTSVSGLGPVGFGALLRRYGTGRAIVERATRPGATSALIEAGTDDGRETFGRQVADRIVAVAFDPFDALRAIEDAGVEVLTLDDSAYPMRLRAIEMPPHVLFVAGDVAALSAKRAVAVVGTRRATLAGRLTAARIGGAIAKTGASVVSGLAVGIDGAAQAAVIAEGGITVGVLGSGHRRLYPQAHAKLAEAIVARGGAVVSEFGPNLAPSGGTFPRRNRLISGLSDATVVVEAGEGSGALITAGWALEQGRECFIVPGPIDAPRSAGCLRWLREYAGQIRIVAGIPELIEDLGLLGDAEGRASVRQPSLEAELIELGATARSVALELVKGRSTLDELVVATGHPVATALGALTLLEIRGLATGAYGRYRPAGRLASADPPRPSAA